MELHVRVARQDDVPALEQLIARSVSELQRGFLSPDAIRASRAFMSIDTQLLRDGTYLCAMIGDAIAGCGGWSWRRTLFGGDQAGDLIDPAPLDPASEPARIRAMYTDPAHARRGVGRAILAAAEARAREAGFREIELMSTLAGEPLYLRCGYKAKGEPASYGDVPLIPMRKSLID